MRVFLCCLSSLHVEVVVVVAVVVAAAAAVKWLMIPAAAAVVYLILYMKKRTMMMKSRMMRRKLVDVVSAENPVQMVAQERVFYPTKLSTAVVMAVTVIVVVMVVVAASVAVVAERLKMLKKPTNGLCLRLAWVWTIKVVVAAVAPFSWQVYVQLLLYSKKVWPKTTKAKTKTNCLELLMLMVVRAFVT